MREYFIRVLLQIVPAFTGWVRRGVNWRTLFLSKHSLKRACYLAEKITSNSIYLSCLKNGFTSNFIRFSATPKPFLKVITRLTSWEIPIKSVDVVWKKFFELITKFWIFILNFSNFNGEVEGKKLVRSNRTIIYLEILLAEEKKLKVWKENVTN